jgi:hypothetical protein
MSTNPRTALLEVFCLAAAAAGIVTYALAPGSDGSSIGLVMVGVAFAAAVMGLIVRGAARGTGAGSASPSSSDDDWRRRSDEPFAGAHAVAAHLFATDPSCPADATGGACYSADPSPSYSSDSSSCGSDSSSSVGSHSSSSCSADSSSF